MKLRNSIHFGLMHLHNKKSIFILSSIILLVGIIVTYHIFSIYFSVYKEVLETRKVFGDNRENLYKINSAYITTNFVYYETYHDFLMELRKYYDIGIYECTSLSIESGCSSAIKEHISQNLNQTGTNQNLVSIPVVKIDNELVQTVGIRTDDNKTLQLKIREDGQIEVAAGSFYKEVVNIGDTFENPHTGKKYIITSFLEEGQEWIPASIYNNTIISLDTYFLTPFDLQEYTDFSCAVYVNNVYLTLNPAEAKEQINKIETLAEKNNIFIDIVSYKENEQEHIAHNKSVYDLSLLLSIIMFITVFVVIGIMAILSWMFDYHDIGILYANGFTDSDIRNIILHENLFKMVFPLMLSYGYLLSSMSDSGLDKSYSLLIYGVIIFIYTVEMVLCSYLSYRFIRRYAPIRLLGGEGI